VTEPSEALVHHFQINVSNMSRWYLTSSESASRAAQIVCGHANLRSSGKISDMNCHGQAYFKRVVATPNLIHCGENNWICSAGTMIYNDQLGEKALRECYLDFVRGGIPAIQDNAIGHYALAIKLNNEVTIFTDPQGSLNLYYAHSGSYWFVANSLLLCASVLSNRKIDAGKLLITALANSLPGEDTFYSGIKRLFGTQQIRIDLAANTFRVEPIPRSLTTLCWDLPSIQDAIGQFKQELRIVFRGLSAVGTIGLFGTGGLDSRTVLAGLLEWKAPIQLMYGMGNSRLTDYDIRDLNVVKAVADRCKLPFQQLDWSGNQPHSPEALEKLFRTHGFKFEIYGAPDAFLRTYDGGISPYPKLLLGGRGPALSNSKPWELSQTNFGVENLIADGMRYQWGNVDTGQCIIGKTEYRSAYATELKAGLRSAGIDFPDTGASLESYVKTRLYLYIRAESRYLNFANEFAHYIDPFLLKRLHDPLLSMPLKYRAKDEFQLRLIHSLAPALVEMPLYSGWSPARIDRNTFRFIREEAEPKSSIVRRIASAGLPAALKKPARNICRRLGLGMKATTEQPAGRDVAIVEAYSRQIMNDPLGRRWFRSTSEFTPKTLARIRHYLSGVNTLGYSE
jgi:hypothetical protein